MTCRQPTSQLKTNRLKECGSSTNSPPSCSQIKRIKKVAAREPGLSERIEFRRDLSYEEMKTVMAKLSGLEVEMLEQEADIPVNNQLKQKRKNRKYEKASTTKIPNLLFTCGFKEGVLGLSDKEVIEKASNFIRDGENPIYNSEKFRYVVNVAKTKKGKPTPSTFYEKRRFPSYNIFSYFFRNIMETPKKKILLTHVAKDFSSLSGGYRYGPEVMCANTEWRIGYRKTESQSLDVQLFCRRARTDKIWSVATKFSIRLISVNGKVWSVDASYTFANNSDYNGYGLFFGLDTLLKHYVVDETLVIEIKATIEAVTGVEKPEKKRSFEKPMEEPTDLILKVAEQKFHVTKRNLVAQSEYFKKLLIGTFKQKKQKEIELKEIDPNVFQVFLELVYMEDALTDDNIEDVLKLVDMYFAKICEQFLIYKSKLSMRTKLQIAGEFKFEKLKNQCIENVKNRADVRAVLASDPSQLDASICHALLEKLVTL
ncbi:unnamed protein product [Caenorhabditis brenneri]